MTPAVMRGRMLEALLESATDYAILAMDPDGVLTLWNEGAHRILGWTEAEVIGRPSDLIFTDKDRQAGVPTAERRTAFLSGRATDERWHARRDGSQFWASGEMTPVRDHEGVHLGYLKVLRDRTQQRLDAERQRADAEFLRSVLEASGDCIKVLDLDTKLVFMSEAGRRAMEISAFNAIEGCPWPDFWEGEGLPQARAAIEAAKAGGVGQFEGTADTMAGNPRIWDVQVTPMLGADGRPEKLLVVSRDVTATRSAERALREAEALNTLVLQSSRDCIVVLDLDGNTRFVSPGGIAAMEVSDLDAVIGLSWLRVWDGEDHVAALAAVAQARAGGVGRFQGFCETHKGTPKWWDVLVSPLAGKDGQADGLVTIARDVTEQRRAEVLLRDTEERRRLAVEAADMGTWSFDLDRSVLDADERCRVLFGLPPGTQVTYDSYVRRLHPDDRERVLSATRQAIAPAGPGTFLVDYRTTSGPDGAERWVSAAARTHFEGGRAVRLVGTVRDVTTRKRAEEQARLLGDELQHRVKNTLAMVQAIVRQTLRSVATPEEAQVAIDARVAALARANDMLTQSAWEGADMRQVAELALLPHDDGAAGRFRIAGPPVWLPAPAAMSLSLMLNELATNAAKYGALSSEGGHVDLFWEIGPPAGGEPRQSLTLEWRESDGPPVTPPAKRGFGSRLIERGLASALAGTAVLAFPREGVICRVIGSLPTHAAEPATVRAGG